MIQAVAQVKSLRRSSLSYHGGQLSNWNGFAEADWTDFIDDLTDSKYGAEPLAYCDLKSLERAQAGPVFGCNEILKRKLREVLDHHVIECLPYNSSELLAIFWMVELPEELFSASNDLWVF